MATCTAALDGEPCIRVGIGLGLESQNNSHVMMRTDSRLALPFPIHVAASGRRWTAKGEIEKVPPPRLRA